MEILVAGAMLAVVVALGVMTFGAVPAIAAGVMAATGITALWGATLLGLGSVLLGGFLSGMFAAAMICFGVDRYRQHHAHSSSSPKVQGTNTTSIFKRIKMRFSGQAVKDHELTLSTEQSSVPASNLTCNLEPTRTPDASRNISP